MSGPGGSARAVVGIQAGTARRKRVLGWRERVALPQLGLALLEAKVDTGARTSALHTVEVEPFTDGGRDAVRFLLRPGPDSETLVRASAPVKDRRVVRDSGGREEERYIIETDVRLGDAEWPIEVSLTNRDGMGFPMLLGRTAIRRRFVVDPARSYSMAAPTRPATEVTNPAEETV